MKLCKEYLSVSCVHIIWFIIKYLTSTFKTNKIGRMDDINPQYYIISVLILSNYRDEDKFELIETQVGLRISDSKASCSFSSGRQ